MASTESSSAAPDAVALPVAVIDIGSNSVRLVVFTGAARSPVPMFNEKMLCGLGRNLGETGRLDEAGVELALTALKRFTGLVREMKVEAVQAVATAAVRDAGNGPAFVERAERECGMQIRVLTGQEEALLSAQGVISGIPDADGLMGDLGGGSLELVHLVAGAPGDGVTLPLGPLRMAGFKDHDSLRDHIDGHFEKVKWLAKLRGRTLYLVGGSWRGLARIHMAQARYPLRIIHHYRIAAGDAEEIARLLSRQSKDSLIRIPGVSKRRLDVLPSAALVLRRLIKAVAPKEVVFSAHGLREGLCYAPLPARIKREDPLLAACAEIGQREGRFGASGRGLFTFTSPLFEKETPAWNRLRRAACDLSDIAWRMHPDHRGEYVVSRILNDPFAGIDHVERAALAHAVCVRYTGNPDGAEAGLVRSLMNADLAASTTVLGLSLRLAQTLSAGTAAVIEQVRLRLLPGSLVLEVQESAAALMGDVIERRLAALAAVLNCKGEIKVVRRR
jgi:exopolyphosphatase/guanosine-5'-triphosphate,3'-diphosphate pyrophosphatase